MGAGLFVGTPLAANADDVDESQITMLGLLPTPLYHDEDWNNWLKGDIRSLAVTGCSAEGVVVDSSPAVEWTLESNTTGVEVNLSSAGNVAFFQVGTNAEGGWNGGTVRIKIQLVSDPNVSVMLETRIFDYFIDLSSHSMGNATIERGNSTPRCLLMFAIAATSVARSIFCPCVEIRISTS